MTNLTQLCCASRAAVLAGALLAGSVVGSYAEEAYPSRTVTIVVPFAAGSATDAMARLLANEMEKAHGKPIVVANKPGGGGNPGVEFVAKSAPDGYTLLLGAIPTAANQGLYKNLRYDTRKDLIPISQIAVFPQLVVVNANTGIKSIKELIEVGKTKKLNAGSSGVGTSQHLSATLFEMLTGVRFQHIYYKGSSAIIADLLNGLVEVSFSDMVSIGPALEGDKVRAIGITALKRSARFPDVPTVDEAGVPGFSSVGWYGLFAPTGTPQAIVDILYADARKTVENPEVIARIRALGGEPVGSSPAVFSAYVNEEIVRWTKVAKEFGIAIE